MTENERAIETRRVIKAERSQVLAAWTTPERLARWWGPAGFTNDFRVCDIRPGGTWSFTMIGPKGAKYSNESHFVEVSLDRVVIEHRSNPKYILTAEFKAQGAHTEVFWSQAFEDAETCAKLRAFIGPKNEENLDRLEAELGLR